MKEHLDNPENLADINIERGEGKVLHITIYELEKNAKKVESKEKQPGEG